MIQAPVLEIRASASEHSTALEAVANLFEALHQHGIRYCHWKSNLRLEQSLQGRTDLDLLVDRAHSQLFRQIVGQHNLKPVLAAPGQRFPAMEHYLGFDQASGKLFHLHVHYQLVLGEEFIKNYRLPLEGLFLDSVQLQHGVKIPAPELEIIVLSLRALLKYRDRDAVKDILSIRSSGLAVEMLKEIEWLLAQTSMEGIAQTLDEVAAVVPAEIVLEFLAIVASHPRAGFRLYRLRNRLRRALSLYQRSHSLLAVLEYLREMWRRRKSFFKFSPTAKMTLANGGIALGLIGADGAGKSTLCQLLARWLAWKLDVHVYYLGSKQPSRRSAWLYLLFRIARRGQRAIGRVLGEKNVLVTWLGRLRDTFLYAHYLSVGQDRYRRYLAGQKKAMAGSIVIYDRCPLESVSAQMGRRLMDGPQIPPATDGQGGAIIRAFSRVEQGLYRQIRPPDYLVVLDVSPEVSLQRKPDHNRAKVEAKSQAVDELMALAELDTSQLRLIHLDANLLLEEVVRQLKTRIWEVL